MRFFTFLGLLLFKDNCFKGIEYIYSVTGNYHEYDSELNSLTVLCRLVKYEYNARVSTCLSHDIS